MRIKEVEKATGLTAKAIRLYESKGLLSVSRQAENDYRDYSPEDVKRLKTIAVLRRLDVSVANIKRWCDGEAELTDLISQASFAAHTEEEQSKEKKQLTGELLKILRAEPETDLAEAIEEAELLRELYRELDDLGEEEGGNLLSPILSSIFALGPIGWTVLHILDNRAEDAIWAFVLSIPMAVFAAFRWARYFQVEKHRRTKSGCLPSLLFAVFGIIGVIGFNVFIGVCQEALFVPDEKSLYVFRQPWLQFSLLVPLIELAVLMLPGEKEEAGDRDLDWRGWIFVVGINLVLIYGSITAVTVCSDNGFVRHSFLAPQGKDYTLEDVVQVEAGFYGNGIPLLTGHESGDFYYKVTFADGTTENWAGCSAKLENVDPWYALLELDDWLMTGDVVKISNYDNRDRFMYDQECLDICDTILKNGKNAEE